MQKRKYIIVGMVLLSGCGYLKTVTPQQPIGAIADPNQVQAWISGAIPDPNEFQDMINVAMGTGETLQAVGVATGNPSLVSIGLLIVALVVILSKLYGRKQNGES